MKGSATVFAAAAVASMSMPSASEAQLVSTGLSCEFTVSLTSILSMFDPDAADCLGAYSGNDAQQVDAILAQIALAAPQGFGMTDATYLGTTDSGATDGPFSSVPDGSSGLLVFDSPLTGDYVLALKSATSFSLYLFTGLVNQASIYYVMNGVALAPGGPRNPQDLSHASLFGPRVSVPEPESFALLATGLIGLGFVALRRRKEDEVEAA